MNIFIIIAIILLMGIVTWNCIYMYKKHKKYSSDPDYSIIRLRSKKLDMLIASGAAVCVVGMMIMLIMTAMGREVDSMCFLCLIPAGSLLNYLNTSFIYIGKDKFVFWGREYKTENIRSVKEDPYSVMSYVAINFNDGSVLNIYAKDETKKKLISGLTGSAA